MSSCKGPKERKHIMLIGKYGCNSRAVFITLLLCSLMFAEPVLAQKTLSKSSASSGEGQKSLQVARPSAAIKVQPARGVTVSLSKPRIGLSASRSVSGISISRITKSSIGQPSSVISSPRTSSATLNRASTLLPVLRSPRSFDLGSRTVGGGFTLRSSGLRSHDSGAGTTENWLQSSFGTQKSFSSRMQTEVSSSIIKRPTKSLDSSISSNGTLRVGSWIGRGNTLISPLSRRHENTNLRVVDSLRAGSRPKNTVPDNRINAINDTMRPEQSRRGDTHAHSVGSGPSGPVAHRDHPQAVRHIHPYEHVYWDCHNRLCHRIVRPGYCFLVSYGYGPYYTYRYVYPYYLRRYIFVSLGGYWPVGYRYIRYYWYGCHPYRWYGYYPIAYELKGDTYNYYTYNYYYENDDTSASELSVAGGIIKPVDHNTFADVREKLARQQAEEPEPETLADGYFDEGVKAFETGDYNVAIEKFAKAIELAPDDMVLPFAYSQALFANERYADAADALREALVKGSSEKEGVFYPRGLYSDDEILFEQIELLTKKAELYSFDADLQLLLGYQLLGIGEIDKAVEPLQRASQDFENATAATILLDLLAEIRTDNN